MTVLRPWADADRELPRGTGIDQAALLREVEAPAPSCDAAWRPLAAAFADLAGRAVADRVTARRRR